MSIRIGVVFMTGTSANARTAASSERCPARAQTIRSEPHDQGGVQRIPAAPGSGDPAQRLGTGQSHLRLFDSDLVRRLTDTTTMNIDAFIEGKPMSLYIIVPPARLTAYRQLLRMWLSGLMVALTQRKAAPASRTLMLCYEIGNVGKMDAFLMGATLMASWGLTLWSFWQNPDQLKIYGPQANTLVDNAGVL
jgi:type IV secretion system protein VirD4